MIEEAKKQIAVDLEATKMNFIKDLMLEVESREVQINKIKQIFPLVERAKTSIEFAEIRREFELKFQGNRY